MRMVEPDICRAILPGLGDPCPSGEGDALGPCAAPTLCSCRLRISYHEITRSAWRITANSWHVCANSDPAGWPTRSYSGDPLSRRAPSLNARLNCSVVSPGVRDEPAVLASAPVCRSDAPDRSTQATQECVASAVGDPAAPACHNRSMSDLPVARAKRILMWMVKAVCLLIALGWPAKTANLACSCILVPVLFCRPTDPGRAAPRFRSLVHAPLCALSQTDGLR